MSCIGAGNQSVRTHQAYCKYESETTVARSRSLGTVYVFPPLLADVEGNPLEKLEPVMSGSGGIQEWSCHSAKSKKIQNSVKNSLRASGYRVVDFSEALSMREPHSVLMMSLFYTKPIALAEKKDVAETDMSVLTMVKTKTFGLDFNPASSQSYSNINAITYYSSESNTTDIEERTFQAILNRMGDQISGMLVL